MAVIVCPICSTRYRVTEAQLSQASRLKCKKCKTVFPVSDNIKTDRFSQQEKTPTPSPSISEPEDTSDSLHTLEFPGPQSEPPQTSQEPAESLQDESSGFGDFSLDFNLSSEATVEGPSLDFSFSAEIPETPEGEEEEEVVLEDHIVDSLHTDQGEIEVGLGNLSLDSNDNGETTLSMEGGSSLDFSFSAAVPESGPEEEDQYEESSIEEGDGDGGAAMQDLSLSLDLGAPQVDDIPEDATMTMAGSPEGAALDISLDRLETEQEADIDLESKSEEYAGEVNYADEEPLDTCCVDSLAMGYTTCEICGRNLEGLEENEFVQQRRQQLRAELPEGEAQIGFSREGETEAQPETIVPPEEDFSDVERALDALADGSFEKEIKKREAKKHRGQRLQLIGAGLAFVILVIVGVAWFLLPSSHERLLAKYEELTKQPEIDPKALVDLFLQSAAKQDQEIFEKVSVMSSIPDISGGSALTVGEDYEPTSLGHLGQDIIELQTKLDTLTQQFENTEKQWQEASTVDLSPSLLRGNIQKLTQKQETLQAEMDAKVAESIKKSLSLQQEITEAEQDLEMNRQRAEKHVYDTDEQGKAIYLASVRNQQSLSDKIGKLEGLLADEQLAHAKRMQEIEAEYVPQLEKIRQDLDTQQALYEKALLYSDDKNSPLVVLDKELKELKNAINEIQQTLQEKQQQFDVALAYFKRSQQRMQVEQQRNEAEFAHISKNVMASVKFPAGKQKVPIVLKRYQAIIGDQTIQGDWVVEAILR